MKETSPTDNHQAIDNYFSSHQIFPEITDRITSITNSIYSRILSKALTFSDVFPKTIIKQYNSY